MKWFCLIFAFVLPLSFAGQPATGAFPSPRFLIVIDNSFSMARSKKETAKIVEDLLLGGFDGQIQSGETFSIWPLTESSGPQFERTAWHSETCQQTAEKAAGFIKHLHFALPSRADKVLPKILQWIQSSPRLTVLIVTSGDRSLYGTPFDRSINLTFDENRWELHKHRLPFVVTLFGENKQLIGFAIHSGAPPVRLPRPPSLALAAPQDAASPGAPAQNPDAALQSAAKPNSVSNAPAGHPPSPPSKVDGPAVSPVAAPLASALTNLMRIAVTNSAPPKPLHLPAAKIEEHTAPALVVQKPKIGLEKTTVTQSEVSAEKRLASATSTPPDDSSPHPESPVNSAATPVRPSGAAEQSHRTASSTPSAVASWQTNAPPAPVAATLDLPDAARPVRRWPLIGLAGGAIALALFWITKSKRSTQPSLISKSYDSSFQSVPNPATHSSRSPRKNAPPGTP